VARLVVARANGFSLRTGQRFTGVPRRLVAVGVPRVALYRTDAAFADVEAEAVPTRQQIAFHPTVAAVPSVVAHAGTPEHLAAIRDHLILWRRLASPDSVRRTPLLVRSGWNSVVLRRHVRQWGEALKTIFPATAASGRQPDHYQ